MAANRVGKTLCGAGEMAMHLTGLYPSWWCGRVFDRPIRAWATGVTGESVRDVVQEKLIGPPMRKSDWGTGLIPKHLLGEISSARGIADLIDSVTVKLTRTNETGGIVYTTFTAILGWSEVVRRFLTGET